ncbi:MAG: OadG family protein [Synergistaceae bacterium]|jgi:hypothetical protein|nr:OadG family protein [Synergistaceae bacterium]
MNGYEAMSFFWLLLTIVAVSLVFLVVIGVAVTAILKKICAGGQERPSQREAAPASAVQAPAPAPAAVAYEAPAPSVDDDEIVAVITAAVAAVCGQEASVVSVTPTCSPRQHQSTGSMWRFAGRLQNLEGFSDI